MFAQRHRRWPSITLAWRRGREASPAWQSRSTPANTGESPNAVSMLGQRRRLLVNIETELGECHVFADAQRQYIDTAGPFRKLLNSN